MSREERLERAKKIKSCPFMKNKTCDYTCGLWDEIADRCSIFSIAVNLFILNKNGIKIQKD